MLQLFTPEFTSSKGLRAAVSGRDVGRDDVETSRQKKAVLIQVENSIRSSVKRGTDGKLLG